MVRRNICRNGFKMIYVIKIIIKYNKSNNNKDILPCNFLFFRELLSFKVTSKR